jgi:hypothetical protein
MGAIIGLIAMPLSWQKAGGIVLEVRTAWGFAGPGWLMFAACVLMLALIVLPYTTRTRQLLLDRAGTYLLLLLIALGGLLAAIVDLIGGEEEYSLAPPDGPRPPCSVPGLLLASTR